MEPSRLALPANICAILFDADGVIVNPMMQFARHLDQMYGITRAHTRNFFEGVFHQCLLGQARLEDVLPPFLSEWAWPGSLDEFIAAWLREDHHVDERLADAIRSLRRRGYLCALATLQERRRADYMRREMGFGRLFDRLFFSCELGCMKTDPEFYIQIERQLALPPQAILFWDDSGENVQAARRQGWNAEVYSGFDDFSQKIGRYDFR